MAQRGANLFNEEEETFSVNSEPVYGLGPVSLPRGNLACESLNDVQFMIKY